MELSKAHHILITLAGIVSIISLLYLGYHMVSTNKSLADINWWNHVTEICMVIVFVGYKFSTKKELE